VIVLAIVLPNLYLRQRLKINKELKKAGRRKRILQFDFSGGR